MASLRRGDVVLVPFPFADLSGSKVRPAVIVSADPQEAEIVIAFITSVLTNRSPRGAHRPSRDCEAAVGVPGKRVPAEQRVCLEPNRRNNDNGYGQ